MDFSHRGKERVSKAVNAEKDARLVTEAQDTGHCPWTCQRSPVQYRNEEYPETTRLLDNSLVVGSQSAPLAG
jgi:hypothetical protein